MAGCEFRSLIDVLRARADDQGTPRAFTLLGDGETESASLSYAELYRHAQELAASLRRVAAPGDRALLFYPHGLEFLPAFFGCLQAGVVAVPLPPPEPGRLRRTASRLHAVVADSGASLVLTTSGLHPIVRESLEAEAGFGSLRWGITDEMPSESAPGVAPPEAGGIAYLQYTSGSTSTPKGVVLRHDQVLDNSARIREGFRYGRGSVLVTWVPYFHDDGLVQSLIQPLFTGFPCYLIPPAVMVQRPLRWLRAVARYRATHSGGPNFAYEIAARRARPEDCEGLDLSSWEVAYNAAKPIRPETLRRFARAFGPFGFRWSSFVPAYGMAEATLLVTACDTATGPVVRNVRAEALELQGRAEDAMPGERAREVVGCGRLVGDARLLAVDPVTRIPCSPDQVGEVWLAGPSVADGYWQRPGDSQETFGATLADSGEGPFLRTGDLAFLGSDGELYITGRLKDLIILRGRNHAPQDIELTVERSHPALRPGCCAAFSVEAGSEERLVVVQEVDTSRPLDVHEIAERICREVAEVHDVQVHALALLPPRALPKTSSGKIQRRFCREELLGGRLEVVGSWQLGSPATAGPGALALHRFPAPAGQAAPAAAAGSQDGVLAGAGRRRGASRPFASLVELLRTRADEQGAQTAFTLLADGETETTVLTYAELEQRSRELAVWLCRVAAHGDRALLVYPNGVDFLPAFFGCLYAGLVAVPVPPPDPGRLRRTAARLHSIVIDSGASVVLTTAALRPMVQESLERDAAFQDLHWVVTDEVPAEGAELWRPPPVADGLVYLQYTSGSTSTPKGVIVRHEHVLDNAVRLQRQMRYSRDTVVVTWLPYFHDDGLIQSLIQPIFSGYPSYQMPPKAMVERPARWIRAMGRYRGTHTGCPNFGYELASRRVRPEECEGLDLSSWRYAYNGAEPIRSETLRRFTEVFAPYGFRWSCHIPVWGLAEATLLITVNDRDTGPVVRRISAESMELENRAVDARDGERFLEVVGCGRTNGDDVRLEVVDPVTRLRCARDRVGELWFASPSVTDGYWQRPADTREVFAATLADTGEGPFLRTGDLGFIAADGEVFITGRLKDLIIIRGRNHYPQDIEISVERSHPALRPGCCAAFSLDVDGEERLAAVVEVDVRSPLDYEDLAERICREVADIHEIQVYALAFLPPRGIPKTSSGKIQRRGCRVDLLGGHLEVLGSWRLGARATPGPAALAPLSDALAGLSPAAAAAAPPALAALPAAPAAAPQARQIRDWLVRWLAAEVGLEIRSIETSRPFSSLGLDSSTGVRLASDLQEWLDRPFDATLVWSYPTIDALAAYLIGGVGASATPALRPQERRDEPLAVIGMACRFPGGVEDVEAFWRLLREGVDAISEVPRERWDARAFFDPDPDAPGKMTSLWGGFVDGVDRFDADFFGISPREAENMDPQHRLLLEVAWQALESAGQEIDRLAGSRTGVFVGMSTNDFLLLQGSDPRRISTYTLTGSTASIAAGRLSYLLGLQGPSLAVDTACSSSLVALHLACRSLRHRESDLALAAGVNVILSPVGGIYTSKIRAAAPDGRCKSFDAAADGYGRSEGCGVVVLKRLSDALADGDTVLAVVRGTAVNQDGRSNGLTAPNGLSQQALVRQALHDAGLTPDRIDYVETHGSGTPLGDPIEALALAAVLGEGRPPEHPVAIGSVKSNLGHLEAAAGMAGLIKTVEALRHREIPPSLHFKQPNPAIPFDRICLRVQERLGPWPAGAASAAAGVSAFGLGGTNAHVVLEEAPQVAPSGPARPWQLLVLSARTETALETMTDRLVAFLEREPEASLADVAWTCQIGRKRFGRRRILVCRDREDALCALVARDRARLLDAVEESCGRPVAFLFPGLGDQYPGMARGLYEREPVFRELVDRCAGLFRVELGIDLREALFGGERRSGSGGTDLRALLGRDGPRSSAEGPLARTSVAQPAVFVVELALARLLMGWGLRPAALLGHSLGEYVAACLAGVFSLEDGLRLVAVRARLIEELPGGAMLAVPLGETELAGWLTGELSLAAVNAPSVSVAAGPEEEIAGLERRLSEAGIACRRMQVAHAFHSRQMEPLMERFAQIVRGVDLRAPALPWVSNVTGRWIEPSEATDPGYWARHMRQTVRFAEGVETLLAEAALVLVEVGPGQTLGSFVKQRPEGAGRTVVAALRHEHTREDDQAFLLGALGRLWLGGVEVDWRAFARGQRRLRLPLPTYPFERQRYWAGPPGARPASAAAGGRRASVEDWFYAPVWERAPLAGPAELESPASWLIFLDAVGVGAELATHLEGAGHTVVRVVAGEGFAEEPDGSCRMRLADREQYRTLVARLLARGPLPRRIVHLGNVAAAGEEDPDRDLEAGFYSLLWLTQALLAHQVAPPVEITVVTCGAQAVVATDRPALARAAVLGPVLVIPQETAGFACRAVDLAPGSDRGWERQAGQRLAAELLSRAGDPVVAWRREERWARGFAPLRPTGGGALALRQGGVCLITGGLGGIGLILAEHLARERRARLVLIGRSRLPPREEWEAWLASHDDADPVSRKLHRLRAIEAAGGEVLVLRADVASAEPMRQAVAEAERRFGGMHAVIHAAGVVTPEHFAGVPELDAQRCEAHLRPKLRGALVLEEVLRGRDLDFRLLFSSISSVLGGLGFAAYAAANLALDAFAWARSRAGTPWLSICWDQWKAGGASLAPGSTLAEFAMTAEEGAAAFAQALRLGAVPQVIHSTGDLQARIDQWVRRLPAQAPVVARGAGVPCYARPELDTTFVPGGNELERMIAAIWGSVLGIERVGIHDNFFELGGNSLVGMQVIAELGRRLGVQLSTVTLFGAPTVHALAEHLAPSVASPQEAPAPAPAPRPGAAGSRDIAVIGMAGRFPQARDIEELWRNLVAGVEAITFFSDEELLAAGVDAAELRSLTYVKAKPFLEGADLFDAGFFGYSPREAELTDPQQRVFLECAWEALESAGYDAQRFRGPIGLFAGSSLSTYLLGIYGDPAVMQDFDVYQMVIGHDKDSLPTSASYRLNLTGPSVAVQTHCSTSLVAVHLACQSLLTGESDMALAGGVSIRFPQKTGYHYQPGGMESPDGHCRTFDARAQGTLFGEGVGVVVLKRLADALASGDCIRAVIRGTAINNDGSRKVGYAAPSVEGQAKAIAAALANAGVTADTVSYVEAHGTATELGDPIEVTALTQAFRATTGRKGYCAIGSIKTNIGHLDRAAGVSGLIKTVLSLERGVLPPILHFTAPNPEIDFAESPFFVHARLAEWRANGAPRRACVNSLGMGGTNAHVVLEEAPAVAPSGPSRPWQLLPLSAKTASALEAATERLAAHLRSHPDLTLADVAFTLQAGRRGFSHRRVVLCESVADAVASLERQDPRRVATQELEPHSRPVVFLLPGLGDHCAGMAAELYRGEAVFRREADRCTEILCAELGLDLRELLGWGGDAPAAAQEGLDLRRMLGRGAEPADAIARTSLAQPALFVVEYALARLWMSWGVRPQAMIGYSLGEYVAACLAGVLTLEDALSLVARRARLIEELPAGAMLAVPLSETAARGLLTGGLSIAGINSPSLCVLAGPPAEIAALEERLLAEEIACRRIQTSHAFHSTMMEPIAERFSELLAGVPLQPARIPYLSNVTGTWITPQDATDPGYWLRHLCGTVRLEDGLRELLRDPDRVLLEVGPGQALSSLALQHRDGAAGRTALASLPHRHDRQADLPFLLSTLGRLWLAGVDVDWESFHAGERRRRLPLPTYPFERRRYLVEGSAMRRPAGAARPALPAGKLAIDDWFHIPVWKQSRRPAARRDGQQETLLVLADETGLAGRIAHLLERDGATVVTVRPGQEFLRLGDATYTIDPTSRGDYEALLKHLRLLKRTPRRILHAWSVTAPDSAAIRLKRLAEAQDAGFFSLLYLAQALGGQPGDQPVEIIALSNGMQAVLGGELTCPEKATLLGPCKVIAKEYPHLSCRSVDVLLPGPDELDLLVRQLTREVLSGACEEMVAYRGSQRWVRAMEPAPMGGGEGIPVFREGAVWLITGGLGGLGLAMAEMLGERARARLALVGRSDFPPRSQWEARLAEDGGGTDPVAGRIRRLLVLERAGAEVMVLRADVTDRARMAEVIAQVLERWGPIHGVLHAAGVPGEGLIQGKERASAEKVLAPKVAGTLVLEDLLAGQEPEVTILFSSSASLTGGFGEVDYSAANLFLDAFAQYSAGRRPGRVVSINWGPWQWDAWQESLLATLPELRSRLREIRQRSGIAFEEGREALQRILADDIAQVAVLTQGYEAVMTQWGNLTAASFLEEVERARLARPSHPRPNLRTPYVPPRSDLERRIAAVWQELLGIEQVGIDDHFFEMGGNSLIALQALLKLEKQLAIRLSIATLFEGPTVRALSEILSPGDADRSTLEDLDDRGRLRRQRRNWRQTSQRMGTET